MYGTPPCGGYMGRNVEAAISSALAKRRDTHKIVTILLKFLNHLCVLRDIRYPNIRLVKSVVGGPGFRPGMADKPTVISALFVTADSIVSARAPGLVPGITPRIFHLGRGVCSRGIGVACFRILI